MRLAIVSDTHMPRGARRLSEECVERLRAADLIIHAGDLIELAVLRELEALGDVAAVHGNVDTAEVRSVLPARRVLDVGGTSVGLIHDAGPRRGRVERLRKEFPDVDAVIFGHSHLPLHARAADGLQIFNPGSPTERRRAPARTMGIATAARGRIAFEHVILG